MNRREFVKVAVVGVAGIGLGSRLTKALEAQPPIALAPQDDVAVGSCATRLDEFDEPGEVYEVEEVTSRGASCDVRLARFVGDRKYVVWMQTVKAKALRFEPGDQLIVHFARGAIFTQGKSRNPATFEYRV